MKAVQEIVAYFDKRGQLSRRQLHKILEQDFIAADAPSSVGDLCENLGAFYYFRVTGTLEGQVWGTDTYTRDSQLGPAAVHAGLLKPGQSAVLRITIVPGLATYPGTTRNGVTTSDYNAFPQAWSLSAI